MRILLLDGKWSKKDVGALKKNIRICKVPEYVIVELNKGQNIRVVELI